MVAVDPLKSVSFISDEAVDASVLQAQDGNIRVTRSPDYARVSPRITATHDYQESLLFSPEKTVIQGQLDTNTMPTPTSLSKARKKLWFILTYLFDFL